jgi:hypothetical protein
MRIRYARRRDRRDAVLHRLVDDRLDRGWIRERSIDRPLPRRKRERDAHNGRTPPRAGTRGDLHRCHRDLKATFGAPVARDSTKIVSTLRAIPGL